MSIVARVREWLTGQRTSTDLPEGVTVSTEEARSVDEYDTDEEEQGELEADVKEWIPGQSEYSHVEHSPCTPGTCCTVQRCSLYAFFMGVLLILIATKLPGALDKVIQEKVRESLDIDSESAEGIRSFRDSEAEHDQVLVKVFVFNITNPEEILKGGKKPRIKEIGPFTYEQRTRRYNITWHEEGNIIRYQQWTSYVFKPSLSLASDLDTVLCSLNIPFFAVFSIVSKLKPGLIRDLALRLLYKQPDDFAKVFTIKPVREVLFGYFDPALINLANPSLNQQSGLESILDIEKIELLLKDSKFGSENDEKYGNWFQGLVGNVSLADALQKRSFASIYTGKYIPQLGRHYKEWDNSETLSVCDSKCPPLPRSPAWKTAEANKVMGSGGTIFDLDKVSKRQNLTLFIPSLLRHYELCPVTSFSASKLNIRNLNDIDKENLDTVTYIVSPETFMNSSSVKENDAYYQNATNGLLNISRISSGTPLFASKPHFLGGDPQLLNNVEGLDAPEPELHESILNLHKSTGITVEQRSRLQFNLRISETRIDRGNTLLLNLTETFVPLMWMETIELISQHHLNQFHELDNIKLFLRILKIVAYVVSPMAIILACIGAGKRQKLETEIEIRRRNNPLYEALLRDTNDNRQPLYVRYYVNRKNALRHPTFQKQLVSTMSITFTVNFVGEYLGSGKVGYINVWTIDPETHTCIALQSALTCFLVAFFSSMGAVHNSRLAVRLGLYPKLEWNEPNSRCDIFWIGSRPIVNVTRILIIGFAMGVCYCLVFASPVLLLCALLPKSRYHWAGYALFKSTYATSEAVLSFTSAWLKAAAEKDE